jgi:hypothetical protein
VSKSFEIRKKQGHRVLAFLLKNPLGFLSHIPQGFLRLFSYANEIFLGILICRENFRAKNLPSMGTVFSHSSALKLEIFVVYYSFELGIFRLRET